MFGVTGGADVDCDLDVMNVVNPNLAMTNCLLATEHDDDDDNAAATICCDKRHPTDDTAPELYVWDEADVHESELMLSSSDDDQSVQLSVADDQSQHMSAVSTPSPTAVVVSHTTKLLSRQPTIIVTHARHPTPCSTAPVVARMSKTGVLSRIKPAAVTVDGSSCLTVVVSSPENHFR